MSFTELLAQIPALSVQQRREILERIIELDAGDWLDLDDPLSQRDKKIVSDRLALHDADPSTAVPWEQLRERLGRKHKQ